MKRLPSHTLPASMAALALVERGVELLMLLDGTYEVKGRRARSRRSVRARWCSAACASTVFTMYAWLEHTSLLGKLRAPTLAQRRLADDLRSEIRARRPLAEHADAIALAPGATSDGKVLLACRSDRPAPVL